MIRQVGWVLHFIYLYFRITDTDNRSRETLVVDKAVTMYGGYNQCTTVEWNSKVFTVCTTIKP